jgi:hypothetical protein
MEEKDVCMSNVIFCEEMQSSLYLAKVLFLFSFQELMEACQM